MCHLKLLLQLVKVGFNCCNNHIDPFINSPSLDQTDERHDNLALMRPLLESSRKEMQNKGMDSVTNCRISKETKKNLFKKLVDSSLDLSASQCNAQEGMEGNPNGWHSKKVLLWFFSPHNPDDAEFSTALKKMKAMTEDHTQNQTTTFIRKPEDLFYIVESFK